MYSLGNNNKINIRIEDIEEKTSLKKEKKNNEIIINHSTLLEDNQSGITDIYFDKRKDYDYNIHIGRNGQDITIQQLKYAPTINPDYDETQPEFIIQTNGIIKINSPSLNFNKELYFDQLDKKISLGSSLNNKSASYGLELTKYRSGNYSYKRFQLFNNNDFLNLYKILLAINNCNSKNEIIIKDEFHSVWGNCGIIGNNSRLSGRYTQYYNFSFTNNNFQTNNGLVNSDSNEYIDDKPAVILENLEVPEYFCGYPISQIGYLKFSTNSSFTNFIIPKTIKDIGVPDQYIEDYEDSFVNLDIEKVICKVDKNQNKIFHKNCFKECRRLKCVELESNEDLQNSDFAISVGNRSFYQCEQLNTFPFSFVKDRMGKLAFSQCGFTNLLLEHTNLLGMSSFSNNDLLTTVTFNNCENNIQTSGVFLGCNNLQEVNGIYNVYEISASDFFSGCESFNLDFTKFTNLRLLGDSTFANTGVENIESSTLITLNDDTFAGCKKLKTVSLSSCITVGESCFANCEKLKTVSLPKLQEFKISLFENCTELETVSISQPISVIPINMFKNCPNLKPFSFFNNITEINNCAFEGSSPDFINPDTFPNLQSIGASAFADSIKKEKDIKIILPIGVTILSDNCINNVNLIEFEGLGITDLETAKSTIYIPNLKILKLPALINSTKAIIDLPALEELYLDKAQSFEMDGSNDYQYFDSDFENCKNLRYIYAPELYKPRLLLPKSLEEIYTPKVNMNGVSITDFNYLRKMTISGIGPFRSSNKELSTNIQNCPILEELTIQGIYKDEILAPMPIIENCPNLKIIRITGPWETTDKTDIDYGRIVLGKNLDNLEEIIIADEYYGIIKIENTMPIEDMGMITITNSPPYYFPISDSKTVKINFSYNKKLSILIECNTFDNTKIRSIIINRSNYYEE